MNEPLDLTTLKLGDRITIDVVVRKAFEDEIDLETPDGTDNVVFHQDSFQSCNVRFTDQSGDKYKMPTNLHKNITDHIGDATEKITDHISQPQEKVSKPPEIEDVRIATLTADRDAALNRFRENADMKHFVELWEQDQIDYGTAIERAEKAEKELDAALAREQKLAEFLQSHRYDFDIESKWFAEAVVLLIRYDADGNWKGEVPG